MLIAADGEYAGLLSGGCLEGDLREYARAVILSGEPRAVHYDLRTPDELLWGLGLGCEGAMQILLLRAGPENDWQPLAHLAGALGAHAATAIGVVAESAGADLPVGTLALTRVASSRCEAPAPELAHYRAAVVMSHHLASYLAYLSALAQTTIPYVGLLGPAVRREKLLSDLGAAAHRLRPRLHAPVGLALGGRTPESIALAIVAELHAFVHRPVTSGTAALSPPRVSRAVRFVFK